MPDVCAVEWTLPSIRVPAPPISGMLLCQAGDLPMTLKELIAKRLKAIADARALVEAAGKENRGLKPEEQQRFDALMAEAAATKGDIDRMKALEDEERWAGASAGRQTAADPIDPAAGPGTEHRAADAAALRVEYRAGRHLVAQANSPMARRSSPEAITAYRNWMTTGEMRTAASFANDVQADGGYLHAPLQFVAQLIKTIDNFVFARRYATVMPVTTSDSLGAPTLATDVADASWTTEVAAITADATAQFGLRQLTPQLLAKEVDISMKLLMTAAMDPETIVLDRIGYKFAIAEENGYLNGNGTGQPLGIFTASASGVPTSRDVSTGNTTTAITFDGLTNAKYSLKAAHRAVARWIFNRTAVQAIALLKDGEGRYLWQPSKVLGDPDMLLGNPVDESEYAPNTFTTGLYVGALVNWKYYWIADLAGLQIQRLNELLARNSKIGFIGRRYTDGAPVLPEAFSRVALA